MNRRGFLGSLLALPIVAKALALAAPAREGMQITFPSVKFRAHRRNERVVVDGSTYYIPAGRHTAQEIAAELEAQGGPARFSSQNGRLTITVPSPRSYVSSSFEVTR